MKKTKKLKWMTDDTVKLQNREEKQNKKDKNLLKELN